MTIPYVLFFDFVGKDKHYFSINKESVSVFGFRPSISPSRIKAVPVPLSFLFSSFLHFFDDEYKTGSVKKQMQCNTAILRGTPASLF